MSDVNKHIEEYLDYYCNLKSAPEYSVLLKGAWGAGKTWFIKEYCSTLQTKEIKYIYVSLYGMSAISEIDYAFFQQLHPLLSSKGMALAGRVLKGLVKTAIHIDLSGDNKGDVKISSQLPDINFTELLKDTSNYVLIFDDLERSSFRLPDDVFGYINHFVEHQGQKVILVFNEDVLIQKWNNSTTNSDSYKSIKEKLIGMTFNVIPDVDAAVNSFISAIDHDDTRQYLSTAISIIRDIYFVAAHENLRALKQTIWEFDRLFLVLPKEAIEKKELLDHLLRILMVLSLEIKSGKLSASDIHGLSTSRFLSIMKKSETKTPIERLINKYDGYDISDILLTERTWIDYLDKGILSTTVINESLLRSNYFYSEKTPAWVKLWHFHDITDDEYYCLLTKVVKSFENREYDDIGVVKHVVGMLMRFAQINIYSKTISEILDDAKHYIDDMKLRKKLKPPEESFDSDSYAGLGYAGLDIDEYKVFLEYIDKKTEESILEGVRDLVPDLIDLMNKDPQKFYQAINSDNQMDIPTTRPIFKYVPIKDFFDAFMEIGPSNQRTIMYAFDRRYKFVQLNSVLVEELEWLRAFKKLLIQEITERKNRVTGYTLEKTILPFIEKSIQILASMKEKE